MEKAEALEKLRMLKQELEEASREIKTIIDLCVERGVPCITELLDALLDFKESRPRPRKEALKFAPMLFFNVMTTDGYMMSGGDAIALSGTSEKLSPTCRQLFKELLARLGYIRTM